MDWAPLLLRIFQSIAYLEVLLVSPVLLYLYPATNMGVEYISEIFPNLHSEKMDIQSAFKSITLYMIFHC